MKHHKKYGKHPIGKRSPAKHVDSVIAGVTHTILGARKREARLVSENIWH